MGSWSRVGASGGMWAVLLGLVGAGCSASEQAGAARGAPDQHQVYFVGYVYDGASGVRLSKPALASLAIKYRDKTIASNIEADGRFVTQEPLPTWQDYAVTITADGFRPFVSRNPGIDVPMSLSMTDGVAGASTRQTFHFDAYLFPVELKAPKVALSFELGEEGSFGGTTPPARASGSVRLRPESSSIVDVGAGPGRGIRRWANDEDLLTQTVTRDFTDGKLEIGEGELVYGVSYQIVVFDVRGYQPEVLSGEMGIRAGFLSSRTIVLKKELRDPIKILSTTASSCTPPAGNASSYAAEIKLVFNDAVELFGTTAAEDIDNGVVVSPSYPTYGTGNYYCGLNSSADSQLQERGTKLTVSGSTLTLSFNPSVGINTTLPSGCIVPATLTSVTYSNLSAVQVRPVGDTNPLRRQSLGTLINNHLITIGVPATSSISCPMRL
jgi:hypothetical protein